MKQILWQKKKSIIGTKLRTVNSPQVIRIGATEKIFVAQELHIRYHATTHSFEFILSATFLL
jgi:hypothetical protein